MSFRFGDNNPGSSNTPQNNWDSFDTPDLLELLAELGIKLTESDFEASIESLDNFINSNSQEFFELVYVILNLLNFKATKAKDSLKAIYYFDLKSYLINTSIGRPYTRNEMFRAAIEHNNDIRMDKEIEVNDLINQLEDELSRILVLRAPNANIYSKIRAYTDYLDNQEPPKPNTIH